MSGAPLALLLVLAAPAPAEKASVLPSIYGTDDRKDLHEAAAEHRKLADSVAVFLPKDKLSRLGQSERWFFSGGIYDNRGDDPLCPGVRFAGQPTGAVCTAALVAPGIVLTAAHCVDDGACGARRLAFGYGMTTKNRWPTNFDSTDLFDCRIIERSYDRGREDWALLALDRPVPDARAPLKIDASGAHPAGTKVLTIGTPSGLPLKVSDGAVIRGAGTATRFDADLDVLGGNSGGPVFDSGSLSIIGVVMTSGPSYADKRGCVQPWHEADPAAKGVILTGVTKASAFLPALERARAKESEDAARQSEKAKVESENAGQKARSVIRATGWIPAGKWPDKE